MNIVLAASSGGNPLWYATRSTAVVAFVLLTLTIVLGVGSTQRALASPAWPRFATQTLHRNVSLIGLGMIVAHIVTTLMDTYVTISWWSVFVPFASSYKKWQVTAGTLTFDLLVLIIVTSLLRVDVRARAWRAIHWTSYAAWPLALVHFIFTGTDARNGRWGFWLGMVCLFIVLSAVGVRLLQPNRPDVLLPSVFRNQR